MAGKSCSGRIVRQFRFVALLELVEVLLLMPKPYSEGRSRRNFLCPLVKSRCILTDATRPQTVYQYAIAVRGINLFVYAFYLQIVHDYSIVGIPSAFMARGNSTSFSSWICSLSHPKKQVRLSVSIRNGSDEAKGSSNCFTILRMRSYRSNSPSCSIIITRMGLYRAAMEWL